MANRMQARETYAFLDFELVPARRQLLRSDRPVAIGSRAFDLLALFVRRPGEVLDGETLMRSAWPDMVVESVNLRVQVAALRRLLDTGDERSCIATVPGRGYCFTPPVRRLAAPLLAAAAPLWPTRPAPLPRPAPVAA